MHVPLPLQTLNKLSKATELLRLMLGPSGGSDPKAGGEDSTRGGGGAGGGGGLRACLGVAQDLVREVSKMHTLNHTSIHMDGRPC